MEGQSPEVVFTFYRGFYFRGVVRAAKSKLINAFKYLEFLFRNVESVLLTTDDSGC